MLVFTWPVCFLTSLVITRGAQEEKKKKMCNNRIGAPYFPTREESILMRLAWEIRSDSQKTQTKLYLRRICDVFVLILFFFFAGTEPEVRVCYSTFADENRQWQNLEMNFIQECFLGQRHKELVRQLENKTYEWRFHLMPFSNKSRLNIPDDRQQWPMNPVLGESKLLFGEN